MLLGVGLGGWGVGVTVRTKGPVNKILLRREHIRSLNGRLSLPSMGNLTACRGVAGVNPHSL